MSLRTLIDETLAGVDERLRASVPGPAVRELRVRYGALSRVVRGWAHLAPHEAQIAAMLECVLELEGQVVKACVPAKPKAPTIRPAIEQASQRASAIAHRTSRPPPSSRSPNTIRASASHARTTRPPPRRDTTMRTTRPPPKRDANGPPSSRRD